MPILVTATWHLWCYWKIDSTYSIQDSAVCTCLWVIVTARNVCHCLHLLSQPRSKTHDRFANWTCGECPRIFSNVTINSETYFWLRMKLWKKLRDSLSRQDIPGDSNFESGGHCSFTTIWMAQWNYRIYWYISFFRPSLNRVLFPMFCLLVEGECRIVVF